MKKTLFYSLIVAAISMAFVSCDDDNTLPNVSFTVDFNGCAINPDNGDIYVVQGDTLQISSISVKNLESDKAAAITDAEYYWNYAFIGNNPFSPYGFEIYTENVPTGNNALTIRTSVVAVDKEPAFAVLGYNVKVVADSSDIPSNAVQMPLTTNIGLKSN